MNKTSSFRLKATAVAIAALAGTAAQAFTFEFAGGRGNFDSTVTAGTGIRMKRSCC